MVQAEAITGIWLEGDGPDHARRDTAAQRRGYRKHLARVGAADSKEERAHEPSQAQESEAAPHLADLEQTIETLVRAEDPETLFCTICLEPIPEARSKRQTATCSEKCKNRLDTIRQHQRANRKCPACLHPSSPAEREEFRVWRASRGDIQLTQVKRDRTLPNKENMALTLRRAARELQTVADTLAANLAGNALETKIEALAIGTKERKQAEVRLERVTRLITDCEAMATPKAQTA